MLWSCHLFFIDGGRFFWRKFASTKQEDLQDSLRFAAERFRRIAKGIAKDLVENLLRSHELFPWNGLWHENPTFRIPSMFTPYIYTCINNKKWLVYVLVPFILQQNHQTYAYTLPKTNGSPLSPKRKSHHLPKERPFFPGVDSLAVSFKEGASNIYIYTGDFCYAKKIATYLSRNHQYTYRVFLLFNHFSFQKTQENEDFHRKVGYYNHQDFRGYDVITFMLRRFNFRRREFPRMSPPF